MHDFTLPANIKQIGSIDDGLRIYIEDYVCTFLHQYAEAGGFNERIAMLVGRHMVIDGQSILFVGGAIHGKYAEKHEGYLRFSDKSIDYTEEMLEEHFPGMEVVGWMQSQPSYGTYLNQNYGAYHLRQFRKPYQVMFVADPLERVNAFYTVNPSAVKPSERIIQLGGYFIYYEKNANMHEYMLANKSIEYTPKPPQYVENINDADDDDESPLMFNERNIRNERDFGDSRFSTYDDGRISKNKTKERDRERERDETRGAGSARKRTSSDQSRATNLLASLCAVLFIVCFVMGVGLIRNQDRIEQLELTVQQFSIANRDLALVVASAENVPAFAETGFGEDSAHVMAGEFTNESALNLDETALLPNLVDEPALVMPVPETYTIQPGDSLLGISIRFFGDAGMVEEILILNGIENADHIVAGRTIALPRR